MLLLPTIHNNNKIGKLKDSKIFSKSALGGDYSHYCY